MTLALIRPTAWLLAQERIACATFITHVADAVRSYRIILFRHQTSTTHPFSCIFRSCELALPPAMARSPSFRLVLAIAVFLGMLLLLALTLSAAQFTLTLWQQLQTAPVWVVALIAALCSLLLGFGLWLSWRLARPSRTGKPAVQQPLTEADLQSQLESASAAGINVDTALRELEELARRRELETVHLALFGEISSGKSSLINALLPGADVATSIIGGTTTRIEQYHWHRDSGDAVVLVDVPGLNQVEREYDAAVMDEAQRAHVVIFVCDGDLTRDEYRAIQHLLALKKPLIVAFNKLDRYSDADRKLIRQHLEDHFSREPQVSIVGIATQPTRLVTRIDADGNEHEETRQLPAQIDELRSAVQAALDSNMVLLEHLRDTAVFELTARKLEDSRAEHRVTASADIVRTYTRRAVAGGALPRAGLQRRPSGPRERALRHVPCVRAGATRRRYGPASCCCPHPTP